MWTVGYPQVSPRLSSSRLRTTRRQFRRFTNFKLERPMVLSGQQPTGSRRSGSTRGVLDVPTDPSWRRLEELDEQVLQIFNLVRDALAGATETFLATDREAARALVARDRLTPRARSLVSQMGAIGFEMWQMAADAYASSDYNAAALLRARDDEIDDLHVGLTAELAAGSVSVPVAIEMGLVARYFERLGDHAVNVTRRLEQLRQRA